MIVATMNATRNGTQAAPPTSAGDLTGEGVDAGAEDVADDEQQQEPRPHHPARVGSPCSSTSASAVVLVLGHDDLPRRWGVGRPGRRSSVPR